MKYFQGSLAVSVLLILLSSCVQPGPGQHPGPGEFSPGDDDPSSRVYTLTGEWIASLDSELIQRQYYPRTSGSTWIQPIPGEWAQEKVYLRTTVRDPAAVGMYGLLLPDVFTSYKVYINGVLAQEKGSLRDDEVGAGTAFFLWEGTETVIVLEVSHRSTRKGMIQGEIVFGPASLIQAELESRLGINYFLAGTFLLVSLFHFFQFIAWRSKVPELYLSLFTLMAFARSLLTDQRFLTRLLTIPFEIQFDLEYFTVFALGGFVTMYLWSSFPNKKLWGLLWYVLSGNFLFITALGFIDTRGYESLFPFYLLVFFPQLVLAVGLTYSAWKAKMPGAAMIFGSVTFIFFVGTGDLLNAMGIVTLGSWFTRGFLIFILVQSLVQSKKGAEMARVSSQALETYYARKKAMDKLIANAAHELKTPLHGISGACEALGKAHPAGTSENQVLTAIADQAGVLDKGLRILLDTIENDPAQPGMKLDR